MVYPLIMTLEMHALPHVTAPHVLGGRMIDCVNPSGGRFSISAKMMTKSASAGSPLLRTASGGAMTEQELHVPFTRFMSKDGRVVDSGRYPDYYFDHGVGRMHYRRHTPRPDAVWSGTLEELEAADRKLHTMKRSYSEANRWPDSTFSRCIWHRNCVPAGGFPHPHTIGGTSPAFRARSAAAGKFGRGQQDDRRWPEKMMRPPGTAPSQEALRSPAGLVGTDRIVRPNTSGPGGMGGCFGA